MREERHFSEIVAHRVKSMLQVACRGSEFKSGTQVYCMSHSGRVDSKNVRQNAEFSVESMRYRGSYKFERRNFLGHFCPDFFLQTSSKMKLLSYLCVQFAERREKKKKNSGKFLR